MLAHEKEQEAIEAYITQSLTELSTPNAERIKAGLQILMTADPQTYASLCSTTVQEEIQGIRQLLLHPETLAPMSMQTESGKAAVLDLIKTFTLKNMSLLDARISILQNTYTVTKSIQEGERLKSVVHTSAIRNVILNTHFEDAITKKLEAEGLKGEALNDTVRLATDTMTALHTAAISGDILYIQRNLGVRGIDINLPNADGLSLLHVAVRENHLEIVQLLLKQPGIKVNAPGNNAWTALHIASRMGFADIVACLVAAPGIDVNIVNSDGWTPLHWAAWHGHREVLTYLLKAQNLKVNQSDKTLTTALHLAARNGHPDAITMLLSLKDIDPTPIDNEGKTPLHYAVAFNHYGACEALLRTCTPLMINIQDMDGLSPLHWAARNGSLEIATRLLKVPGIDRQLLDHNNMTAADWARKMGQVELLAILDSKLEKNGLFTKLWKRIQGLSSN